MKLSWLDASHVHDTLRRHLLVDGFDLVVDLDRSGCGYFVDVRSGRRYVDMFSCFASLPLSLNHPDLRNSETIEQLGTVALHKLTNSDLYTSVYATFVDTLFRIAIKEPFKYAFFIEGGALAVENALKVAFDWKVRKNFQKGYTREVGHKVIHFRQAFHGRSGYTLSMTNTDPTKVAYFPKFDWPRVLNPKLRFPITEESLARTIADEQLALNQIKTALCEHGDDIAALIIEPIQGEGGDNHFRPEFLQALRTLCDENDILLIFDEVQTGVGITGTWWAYEQLDVVPDIMTFGKKMQVCGIVATTRIDDVPENVFHVSSRINSTWGGNLTDMARATAYLQIIAERNYLDNARQQGAYLQARLERLAQQYPHLVSNARGRGLFCAFDLPSPMVRRQFLQRSHAEGLLILGCGEQSIRFRPTLDVTQQRIDEAIAIIEKVLQATAA
ncbi:MAG: L-lysine 6-transaminase [Candidatus Kapaibacterium sp.]|nr:MAG: L-lysine 6-transaminase [Candidatus Kapabacteria bacterium]